MQAFKPWAGVSGCRNTAFPCLCCPLLQPECWRLELQLWGMVFIFTGKMEEVRRETSWLETENTRGPDGAGLSVGDSCGKVRRTRGGKLNPAKSPLHWVVQELSKMEWDSGRRDEGCPNRSCGTCLPVCARINLLTPGSCRAGEGPWGPGRILGRPVSTAAWRQVLQERSISGTQRGKSLHADEEGKKIGCGWVSGQGNNFKPGGTKPVCKVTCLWRHAREKSWGDV